MGGDGEESDDSLFRDIYSSPKQQEEVVKDVGYKASPYHRETRDLLASLGMTPEKDKLSNDKIKTALEEIVQTEDLETLTRKRAGLLLEEKLDVTLTSEHKAYVKNTLAKLVADALQSKKKPGYAASKENNLDVNEVSSKKRAKDSGDLTQGSTQVSQPDTQATTQNSSQGRGIPLTFPKSLGTGAAPFLVELQSEKKVDFSGDTGAVGMSICYSSIECVFRR